MLLVLYGRAQQIKCLAEEATCARVKAMCVYLQYRIAWHAESEAPAPQSVAVDEQVGGYCSVQSYT